MDPSAVAVDALMEREGIFSFPRFRFPNAFASFAENHSLLVEQFLKCRYAVETATNRRLSITSVYDEVVVPRCLGRSRDSSSLFDVVHLSRDVYEFIDDLISKQFSRVNERLELIKQEWFIGHDLVLSEHLLEPEDILEALLKVFLTLECSGSIAMDWRDVLTMFSELVARVVEVVDFLGSGFELVSQSLNESLSGTVTERSHTRLSSCYLLLCHDYLSTPRPPHVEQSLYSDSSSQMIYRI